MATTAVARGLLRPRTWRTVLRAAALATAAGGGWIFVVAPLLGHFGGWFEDFAAYLGAAQAAAAHADIYPSTLQQHPNVAFAGLDFIYPPFALVLLMPLTWVPAQSAATIWLLLDVAATLTACILLARTVLPATWPRVELAIIATFLYGASTYNFWHGQMNPFILLLLVLGLRSWIRGQEVRCGVLIAVAAAIKVAPIVLILLLLRRRWWQGAAACAATFLLLAGAGIAAFGLHSTMEYVSSVLPLLSSDDGWLYIQSWDGVVNRLADHSVLVFQPEVVAIRAAVLALSAGSVLLAAWPVRPQRISVEARAGQFGAGVVAMLLAGSITWYAHDVHLLIAFAAAAVLVARHAPGHRALLSALGATVFCYAVGVPVLIANASMDRLIALQHTGWWYPMLALTSLPAIASGVLLLTLVRAVRPQPEPVVRRRTVAAIAA